MSCSETVIQLNLYTIVPQTYTICGGIYTEHNYKRNTLFLPIFHELNSRSKTFSMNTKAYFSQILFTNLCKSVLVNEMIHLPHRCGISRC